MGRQLINVFNVSVCVCVHGCVYFTCSKEHNSDRSVEASSGANADRHQGHQEGKEDKEYSTQQQNQCGDLPVCNQYIKTQQISFISYYTACIIFILYEHYIRWK